MTCSASSCHSVYSTGDPRPLCGHLASGAVAPKPVSLDDVQAAALPMPAQVALACLDALEIGSGETS